MRPVGFNLYYEVMLYLSLNGDELGYARKCVSCIGTRTIYMLNAKEDIAVVVKKQSWIWFDTYRIEEQWKTDGKSTIYTTEYSWSGSANAKEVYVIKNSDGQEIARTERFRLQFGKMITLKDFKTNSTLGSLHRTAFQYYSTWVITVNKTDIVPSYLFGAIATITTLKEWDDFDD